MQAVPDFQTLEKEILWELDHVSDISEEGLAKKKAKYRYGAGIIAAIYFLFAAYCINEEPNFMIFLMIIGIGICILYVVVVFYRDNIMDIAKLRQQLVPDTPSNVGGEDPRQYHEYYALTPQFFLRKWRELIRYPNPFIHPQKQDLAAYPLDLLESAEAYEKDSQWRLHLVFKDPGAENAGKKVYAQFEIEKADIILFFRTLKDVRPTGPIPKEYAELPDTD